MPDNDVGGEAEVLGGADDFGASDVIGYLLGTQSYGCGSDSRDIAEES